MSVTFESRGEWAKTFRFLRSARNSKVMKILQKYGAMGVGALQANTPKDTGLTAYSWSFTIQKTGTGWEIIFQNANMHKGINIAYILQTGHGTGTGGYVRGIDYINPSLEPIFRMMAEDAFREVTAV